MNIEGKKVIIRPKKPSDADNDYRWQTDPELSALDAMIPSTMSYGEFYREYVKMAHIQLRKAGIISNAPVKNALSHILPIRYLVAISQADALLTKI